ncbi:MAG TPA: MoxR family ATPase [Ilumatobacteraceae bacterium]|jgi:MoxR-like ATPase|nr:MoxR family ATPase [Ilumatobacteraceae bacterium]
MADQVASVFHALIDNVESIVRGKAESIRLALCCLLTEGHLLIDDVPGTGKTSMAKAIAGSIAGSWKRVQFTPDLLPSDVTGVMVFDQRTSSFSFRQGPVFTNVLIGDEINRASPKTQSALLEVMEERQVTADGVPHLVPRPFFVIATQNPRDFHGTFPLPDVQLDRFAMKLSLGYADQATEVVVLESYRRENRDRGVPAVTNATQLEQLIASIEQIEVVHSINDYIVRLANGTRGHPDLRLGVSTRGTLSLMRVAKAYAASEQRGYVTPDDIKTLVEPVFGHRISLSSEAELRGVRSEQVLAEIVDDVAVPRHREG